MKPLRINSNLELKERIVNMEPKHVIYIRLVGEYKSNDYCKAWRNLWNYIRESKQFSIEMENICNSSDRSGIIEKMLCEGNIAHIGIYHDDPKVTESSKLRTDVCLALPFKMKPKGEIGVKEIVGGKYLAYLYQGTYDNLSAVYDTIYGKYLPESGYQIDSRPGFEIYLNDPECTESNKLKTEIYVPVV